MYETAEMRKIESTNKYSHTVNKETRDVTRETQYGRKPG